MYQGGTSRIPHFLENRLSDGCEVVSFTHRPCFDLGNIPDAHFCKRLSQPQGYRVAGRNM
jgi:hypothetical protein